MTLSRWASQQAGSRSLWRAQSIRSFGAYWYCWAYSLEGVGTASNGRAKTRTAQGTGPSNIRLS